MLSALLEVLYTMDLDSSGSAFVEVRLAALVCNQVVPILNFLLHLSMLWVAAYKCSAPYEASLSI